MWTDIFAVLDYRTISHVKDGGKDGRQTARKTDRQTESQRDR